MIVIIARLIPYSQHSAQFVLYIFLQLRRLNLIDLIIMIIRIYFFFFWQLESSSMRLFLKILWKTTRALKRDRQRHALCELNVNFCRNKRLERVRVKMSITMSTTC